jgi:hypothetical protein
MRRLQFSGVLLLAATNLCASIRGAPQQPLLLKSHELSVVFDRTDALPYKYEFRSERIWGEDSGGKTTAILCRLAPRAYTTVELTAAGATVAGEQADFLFNTAYDGSPAASFHVKYTLTGNAVVVTLEQVEEREGFELIEVSLPNLATVREEDGPAWLSQGRDGGFAVDLKNARSNRLRDDRFFGRISTILPVAMLGIAHAECVLEVTAFMDGMEVEIAGEPGHRHARLGTGQTYRVHGGRSYDMNDGGPRISGTANTPNLLVGQTPRCRLDFIGDLDNDGSVDWLDGAKLLRGRMPPIPTHYFDDKFLYLINGKYKTEAEPRTTFAQSETLIHDVAMLTGRTPQVAFVSGWVYDGQDTGYPCEDKVNESMGGYQALKHLMQQGPKYNANVTLNVNYDDAYKSCPQWSPSFIARRPDGQLWKSMDWAGEVSYITGMAKYMQGSGPKRVAYTVERYGIHDAILVDALSWYAIRNDWDPGHPASGYKNLIDGRFKAIDEFLKYGIHVVSEMLRYPYVGKLAESADGVAGGTDPFGGEPIPLVPAIYRHSAIWGGQSGSPRDPARNLFWDSRPIVWYANATNREDITDFYYLTVVPWMKLHNLDIQSYRHSGYSSEIGLGPDSGISIDWMQHRYSVVLQGQEIAGNDATFCPLDDNRIAFYSREARELSAPLPNGWPPQSIAGKALFADHQADYAVAVENGRIAVSVPAGRPIIVYRDKSISVP